LISALLAGASQAAELGEPRVSSHIGQQLVADVELVMLDDPAKPVAVRLAHPEVYRGAGIDMAPVLSTLTLSVMRRDGRQFLHVTSLKPVDTPHLHLYLELQDGSQRNVRLATLWLSPDPNPAPPPAPAPPPVPAAVQAPAVAHTPVQPAKAPPAPVARPRPPAPKPAPKPVLPKQEAPPADKHLAAAPPAACTPQPVPDTNACVVLGAKNAMLREQLGQLEDKVKVLQVAMGAPAASVMPPVKPYKPKKKKAEPAPEAGTPWALVGGAGAAVLALLALLVVLRRRKGAPRRAEPKVGLLARLRARFQRKAAPPKAAEPTLEKNEHESSTQG
jgi:pilus assembly protein FimV